MNSQPGVSDCRERRETLSQRVQGIFIAAGESKSSGLAGALRAVYHSQGLAGFVISLMQILDLVSDRVERDPGGARGQLRSIAWAILEIENGRSDQQVQDLDPLMHRPPTSISVRPAGQCFPELLLTSRLVPLRGKIAVQVASYLASCALADLARLNTKRLAQELNYTRSYLSSKFKREEKVSLHEAILDEKLRRAQMLLSERSANHSVRAVCQMIGYSTPRYFQKIFKRRIGIRPSEFSRTHVEMPAARRTDLPNDNPARSSGIHEEPLRRDRRGGGRMRRAQE